MEEEDWIKGIDTGKGWIPQLRGELLKEESSAVLLIPIFLEAIINLERRVDKLERGEKIRKDESI